MIQNRTITILNMEPDDRGRFHVFIGGGMEALSLARIKEYVAEGWNLIERKPSKPTA